MPQRLTQLVGPGSGLHESYGDAHDGLTQAAAYLDALAQSMPSMHGGPRSAAVIVAVDGPNPAAQSWVLHYTAPDGYTPPDPAQPKPGTPPGP